GSGLVTAFTQPSRTGAKKFVFDSIVAVPRAVSGRLRKAHSPPAASARLINAPPCIIPPAVHIRSSQASRLRTSSGDAIKTSIPRKPENGAAAAICSVRAGSASTAGGYPHAGGG